MNPQQLLHKLESDYPNVNFTEGSTFVWAPDTGTVYYPNHELDKPESGFSLLHEVGHALCGHTTYLTDVDLLRLELEAWQQARRISTAYELEIPEDHIQDCLDSYRTWLHTRSLCPSCSVAGLQSSQDLQYTCVNCTQSWSVPADQTCATRRVRT